MTLWKDYAKPEELARYDELGRMIEGPTSERDKIRNRCLNRAYRERKEK